MRARFEIKKYAREVRCKNNPRDYEIARNFKSGSGLKNPIGDPLNTYNVGLSLSFSQVGGESNSLGFLCLLFFSYFPINVAEGCIRCSWGNIPL